MTDSLAAIVAELRLIDLSDEITKLFPYGNPRTLADRIEALSRSGAGGGDYVLVPREPNLAMLRGLTQSWTEEGKGMAVARWAMGSFREDYQAMLAAAPPQAGEGTGEKV